MRASLRYLLFLALISLSWGFQACLPDDNTICNPAPQFNVDLFIENLEAELDDAAGYQLMVNVGGNLYYSNSEGNSIYSVDPGGPVAMTVNTRMNVASVSKFIGTIALMQVLEKYGISIEEPIHNYLPDSWRSVVHPDHYDAGSPYLIRFRNMLRMQTAIAFAGTNWSPGDMPDETEMIRALTQPAAPERWGVYQNGNFTLIRVLIGEIEYNLNEAAGDYDVVCTDSYFDYIKEHIFDPLVLDPPMSAQEVNDYYTGNFTRAHQWPFNDAFRDASNNLGWGATSNPYLNGGSGGLVLSAFDLAKLVAFFRYDNAATIMSVNQRNLIFEHELGLIESTNGERGRYLTKGGLRGPDGNARALRSRIIFYPNNVEAVLLTNSNVTNLGTILRESFDNAWVPGC